jgi:hypothetical protein
VAFTLLAGVAVVLATGFAAVTAVGGAAAVGVAATGATATAFATAAGVVLYSRIPYNVLHNIKCESMCNVCTCHV